MTKLWELIKVNFVLTAFYWAWTGIDWYDKKTGQLVKGEEKGKNAAKSGYELVK